MPKFDNDEKPDKKQASETEKPFAMACTSHLENEEFKEKLEKEATSVIRKLRNHPSIVVWAGDNEVDSCTPAYNPDNNTLTREVLTGFAQSL